VSDTGTDACVLRERGRKERQEINRFSYSIRQALSQTAVSACCRHVFRFAAGVAASVSHAKHRGCRHQHQQYSFHLPCARRPAVSLRGTDEHRIYPFLDIIAYQQSREHLAYLGFSDETNETSHRILRQQDDGRFAATHSRPQQDTGFPYVIHTFHIVFIH